VAIGATVTADVAALLARARVETWGPWFGLLVGLLALAWSRSRRYVMDRTRNPAHEADALDDIVASLVDVGGMIRRRLPRLGERLVADSLRLDAMLRSSRLSPRRRPWAFCFVVALRRRRPAAGPFQRVPSLARVRRHLGDVRRRRLG
jgi:hypothetical protein